MYIHSSGTGVDCLGWWPLEPVDARLHHYPTTLYTSGASLPTSHLHVHAACLLCGVAEAAAAGQGGSRATANRGANPDSTETDVVYNICNEVKAWLIL